MSAVPHPAVDPSCTTCGGHSYVVERQGELAMARACSCIGACPQCKDTGWVADGDDWRAARKRCTCASIERRIGLFNQARIPGRHATSTLASFEMAPGPLMRAWNNARAIITVWKSGAENRGFVLHGPVGTGKTHLMCAVLRELVFEHGVRVRFIEFSHLLADLRASFEQGGGSGSMLQDLVDIEVLAIDELGKGRNTEWESTVLDELVSRRYNAAATVLATSNYAPAATGHAAPSLASPRKTMPGLPDRVGDRVFSRLAELCDFLEMPGSDWRQRRREAPRTQKRG